MFAMNLNFAKTTINILLVFSKINQKYNIIIILCNDIYRANQI